MADLNDRSAQSLMSDLVGHVTELVRKEIQLFRAEMSDKATQVVIALGSILGAVVFVLTALNVLAAALVAALTEVGIPAVWSAVIVGGLLAVVGFILANRGIANLKAQNLTPERTTRAALRDVDMVKEKM